MVIAQGGSAEWPYCQVALNGHDCCLRLVIEINNGYLVMSNDS